MPTEDELRNIERDIEAVLRKLPLRRDIDIESRLAAAVSRLAFVSLLAPLAKRGASHPTLRQAGKRVTEAELQTLALRLEEALDALNSLHNPAIAALADTGMDCQTARLALDRMLNSVHAADLSRVPPDPERQPSNLFERAVMGNLSIEYSCLTGERLVRSKRFTAFVREMLAVMHIKLGSVENAVRRECARSGKKGDVLHPPKCQRKSLNTIT